MLHVTGRRHMQRDSTVSSSPEIFDAVFKSKPSLTVCHVD